jgi:hypothetical protein
MKKLMGGGGVAGGVCASIMETPNEHAAIEVITDRLNFILILLN